MKKIGDIFLPFLIYFIVHDIAQLLLAYLIGFTVSTIGGDWGDFMLANAATVNGLLNALSLLIGMAAVYPMAHKELLHVKKLMVLQKDENRIKPDKIAAYILLLLLAVMLSAGINILFALTGLTEASSAYQDVAQRQYGVAFAAGILIYGIISPIAEETVFRGLLYNRWKRYFPAGVSIAACGIIFGFYHGNLVQGIYGSILGIVITYIYEVYGTLTAPVLFHAAANLSVFIIGYNETVGERMSDWKFCIVFLVCSAVLLFGIYRMSVKGRKKNNK